MKKIYKAKNISCNNCANLIKATLQNNFGEIEVNLEVEPREVSVNIENKNQEEVFKKEMKELDFEIIE